MRVGLGHDTHRFRESTERSDGLRLGGITIPYSRGLLGHSDADVLLHAVTDAILGAISAGDIGDHFPDTAEENRNRDSADFLTYAVSLAASRGWRVENLDAIIFAQKPKLSTYKEMIKIRIAELVGITPDLVSVKAKTGEGIGIIGREEAISAEAVVLLEKQDKE